MLCLACNQASREVSGDIFRKDCAIIPVNGQIFGNEIMTYQVPSGRTFKRNASYPPFAVCLSSPGPGSKSTVP